ncbi:hypothetical protein GGR54DRAFT_590224 [Hypoxylon sp. NC1633]|nr:hypothetical protein GGR54DRAFT_590224 [Hypoxylon sp. NC1633]
MRASRISLVRITAILSSLYTNVCPMQFLGPCSKGRYDARSGCSSCWGPTRNRSGRNSWAPDHTRGFRCNAWCSTFAPAESKGCWFPWRSVTAVPGSTARTVPAGE